MELIKDLGRLPYGTTGQLKRFGVYRCPTCGLDYTCRTDHVKSGRTTQCKDCAFTSKNKASNEAFIESFLERAAEVHGDAYDYSDTICTGARSTIQIRCRSCNTVFTQSAYRHIGGNGCPKCAREQNSIAKRVYSTKPTYLYLVYFNEIDKYKVGCTSTSIESRFNKDNEKPEIILSKLYADGGVAYRYEAEILKKFSEFLYRGPKLLRSGNTELFNIDISEYIQSYF